MHIPFKEAQDAQVTEKACEIRAWETGGGALERPIGLLVLARTSHQRIALRRDHLRADRFIADWQSSDSQRQALSRSGDHSASGKVREAMAGMAKGLERDPQLESLLRNRTKELGLSFQSGQSLSQDLQRHLGRSLGRGLGL